MARMLKLTLSPSGTLVYRATGRAYQGKATVRDGRVYGRNGRLIGYLGKPTTKQQREINRLDRRRVYDRRRREIDRLLQDLESRYQSFGVSSGEPGAIPEGWGIYTRRKLTEINFGHFLTQAIEAGKMDRAEARKRLKEYLATTDSKDRTALWDDLKDRFKELGFPYP